MSYSSANRTPLGLHEASSLNTTMSSTSTSTEGELPAATRPVSTYSYTPFLLRATTVFTTSLPFYRCCLPTLRT